MKNLTITTTGLINRVFAKNKAKVWHGWSAIDTDYSYLSVDGYWVKGQAHADHCNTMDEGVIVSDVSLDKERVAEFLSRFSKGCKLQFHYDNGYNAPEPVDVAVRTKDGWKLLVDLNLYFR